MRLPTPIERPVFVGLATLGLGALGSGTEWTGPASPAASIQSTTEVVDWLTDLDLAAARARTPDGDRPLLIVFR